MIKLTITEKGGEPRPLSFDQNEVSIGRVQGNDIVLPKGNISKRHSKLTLVDGKMVVADAKSTNGTYVNGRKIGEATTVRPGDKIFVGDFLIVVDPSGAATTEAPTTGSRRSPPPPPPPPPPRPGSGVRQAPSSFSSGSADLGDAAEGSGVNHQSGADRGGVDDSDLGLGLGSGARGGVASTRGRPPAPPPPPPRRTIVSTSLPDDSVDMGLSSDDQPPSPDDIAARGQGSGQQMGHEVAHEVAMDGLRNDAGEPLTSQSVDVGPGAGFRDPAGHDVFGSHPADEEDAAVGGEFPGVAAEGPTHGEQARLAADDPDGLAGIATPPPVSASRAAAILGGVGVAVGDTHAPAGLTLESLLTDPTVTSIVIGTGGAMRVDRAGRIETIPAAGDGNAVAETVWQIANTAVPPPLPDNPVVDVRLLDGTRVTALFPPITLGSVSAVIRKVGAPDLPLSDVAGSADVETILRTAVVSRRNLVVAGDGPAVSTVLGSLAQALPADRRVVSVGTGINAPAANEGWIELGMGNDPAGLARAVLAFQADHLFFADGGGAELPELLLAAARGQQGLVLCMAARSAAEALGRLRAFSVAAVGSAGFSALVTNTVDLVVLVGTGPDGAVRVLEIAEPQAQGDAVVPTFVARRSEKNRTTTILDVEGVSSRLGSAMAASADGLPGHLVRR